MSESFRALCTDFYVNQRLNLKLDLPRKREPILDTFERVRRQCPSMTQFKRYRDELALESERTDPQPKWLAVRTNDIRSGSVNPDSLTSAYEYHSHILEIAPYYLSISPLDIDFLEVLFGFDLAFAGNHDQCVFEALHEGSPLAGLSDGDSASPVDCQPFLTLRLNEPGSIEVEFEVKTRSSRRARESDHAAGVDPISVYLTLRQAGPVKEVGALPACFQRLASRGESIVESRVLPSLIHPIRQAIAARGGA